MDAPPLRLHASCVSLDGQGVLLRGASGAGKSALALRLVAAGARLVADDQVELRRDGDALVAAAPASLAGLVEARGLGLVALAPAARAAAANLALVVDVSASGAAPDSGQRLPDPARIDLLGVSLPRAALAADDPAAFAKLRLALAPGASILDPDAPVSARPAMTQPPDDAAPQPAPPDRPATAARPRVLIVTGMSGAGKSTALKALEDLGYEAVDNLPATLLAPLMQQGPDVSRPLALGIDVRTRDFGAAPFLDTIDALLRRADIEAGLLFLDSDDESLQRRYSQTRRRHPLAPDRPVADGIVAERRRLSPLRERATAVIDTSDLNEGDLKRVLRHNYALDRTPDMPITVLSFAFGKGVPRQADLVFDVRFLKNPHYDEALRPLTGEDPRVGAFVEGDADFAAFYERLKGFIAPLLPRFQAEGKSYLTIALGCTGGRHRSVHLAEKLGAWLAGSGRRVAVRHRELDIDKFPAPGEGGAG
jgi:RNase adaptor protein for sRNA GlmZ degradation